MENRIVLVRAELFFESQNRFDVVDSRTEVAVDYEFGEFVVGVVPLGLEDVLGAPAVGVGAHAVGVEGPGGEGGHRGLADVQVALQDLSPVRLVGETHPEARGGEGKGMHCFVVGGDWSVLYGGPGAWRF